jgi:hypothetical protein
MKGTNNVSSTSLAERYLYIVLQVKAGHVARMGERRDAYRILMGKPEGKRPLGTRRRRLVDNIKMDFREIG